MDDPRVQRSMPARAPRLAGVLVACMALLAVSAYGRAAPACKKGCNRAKSSCLKDARTEATAARNACSDTRAEKRACRKRVKGTLRDSRSACTRFRRGCGTCCAQGGSLCDTRCGDSIVTAARGEQCDPPGSACPGAGTCSESCQCPAIPTTTTTQPRPTTTSTQPTPTTTSTSTTTTPTVTTTSTTLPPTTRVCFEAIASGNARAAASACGIAALAAPQDPAVLLAAAAASAMAAALDDPALAALADRAGIVRSGSAADVCALSATPPNAFPDGTPHSGEVLDLAHAAGLPLLAAALETLAPYAGGTSAQFDPVYLPACLRFAGLPAVEVDAGDVLMARAVLHGLAAATRLASAYDLDIALAPVLNGAVTAESVFLGAPALLTRRPGATAELAAAGAELDAALEAFVAAVASIDAETDDQSDDLLVIDPADRADVLAIRDAAVLLREALAGESTFEAARFKFLKTNQRLRLGDALGASIASLRPLVPPFDAEGRPDPCALPDYTFAGVTPDLTAKAFRQLADLRCR